MIRAHVEDCPQALRVPVDQCCCGGRYVSFPQEKKPVPDMTGVRVRATSRMRISYVIDPTLLYMRIDGPESVVGCAAKEIFQQLTEQFGPITGELVLTLETKEKS